MMTLHKENVKKFIIENTKGEKFEVYFKNRRQLEIWIEEERRYFQNELKIIEGGDN